METAQMFKKENIKSVHNYNGIDYNVFEYEGQIGWSATINNKPYGTFIENSGEWIKNGNTLSPEEAVHINAAESIGLILTK